MALKDVIKKGSGAPAPADLIVGGIGVDTLNKRLYFKADDGTVVPHDKNTPAGNIAATTVQGAINELDTEKASKGANADITSLNALTSINGGQLAGLRNKVINGNFDIWQRGTSFTTTSPFYGPDRWQVFRIAGVAGLTATRIANFSSVSTYYLRLQRDSGNTATNDLVCVTSFETIENYKLLGKQVTLSCKSLAGANFSGGTFSLSLEYGTGTDGNLATGFTSLTAATQSFTPGVFTTSSFTTTVPANATQIGIRIKYTPTGTAGANDWLGITGVQLEIGSVATPFEQRPIGLELSLCQRYYQRIGSCSGIAVNLTSFSFAVTYPVQTRSVPTFTVTGPLTITDGYTADYSQSTGSINLTATGRANETGASLTAVNFAGLTQGKPYFLVCGPSFQPISVVSEL